MPKTNESLTESTNKKYDLQFTYTDNDQVYSEILLLSSFEAQALTSALESLVETGHIRNPDGNPSTLNMLVEYTEPQTKTFADLLKNWKAAYLQDCLDDNEFVWPEETPEGAA